MESEVDGSKTNFEFQKFVFKNKSELFQTIEICCLLKYLLLQSSKLLK